ncbi:MAG: LysR family transcriptional regulator [Devosia sp.]
MDIHHIRFVRAVADQSNISAAARELGLTQPALTKIISRVEDQVGAKLFDRGPRGVTLTPFGEVFLERMAVVEQEFTMLDKEVRARKSGLSGTITLGVGQFWLGRILPLVIARLAESTPDVQVKIYTGAREDLLERLKRGEVDVMLARITDDLPGGMEGEALAEVRMFVMARKGHPLERADKVTPDTLSPYGWILPPLTDPTIRYAFTDVGVTPPRARLEAVSHNLIFSILQASDMVTIVPDMTANAVPEGLCRLRAEWLQWSCSVGVIRYPDRSLLPCCEAFLTALRTATEGLAPCQKGVKAAA